VQAAKSTGGFEYVEAISRNGVAGASNRLATIGLGLSRKVSAKIQRRYTQCRRFAMKSLARAIYAVPPFSPRNPRRNVVRFAEVCPRLEAFPERGNSDLKDWLIQVRPPQVLHRIPSVGLNQQDLGKFEEAVSRYQFSHDFEIPEVFLACLQKAKICSPDFLVLTADNRILFESALSNPDVLERNGILDTVIRTHARRMPGDYCLLTSPWSPAYYYHWLLDALPRLSVLEQFDSLKSVPLVVPESLTGFQRDSLALAGIPPDRLAGFGGNCWKVDRLFFPQLLSPTGNPAPMAVSWLRNRFQSSMVAEPTVRKRLYVSRRDAPKRRVLNEDAVIDFLLGRGFEIVCPGNLSFSEQIALFSQAGIVVGPHGAGMTNMVFAPADATLIEFFGDSYINGCYWALTNLRGQTHAFLTAPTPTMDYEVSLDDLRMLLKKLGVT